MHVCDITMFYTPHGGGVRRYLHAKRRWYCQQGDRHTLLTPGRWMHRHGDHLTLPAPRLPFGQGYRFPLRRAPWVETLVDQAPDLIEAGDPYRLAGAALAAADRLGIPATVFVHSDVERLISRRCGHWAAAPVRAYLRSLYEAFTVVQVPSLALAERLRTLGLTRVVWQPLGVDAEHFHPERRDPSLRADLGLDDSTRLLVFAGRYAREKNIDVLLAAMRRLGSGYHLLLIGPDMPAVNLDNVTVYGRFCDGGHLARLLASADALVHAGDQETFGLVVLEAMASGLPVIGVRGGALPELISPQVGLLAEPRNAAALAEAVRQLFASDWHAMGRAARARVEANYRWEAVFACQRRLYQDLLAGRSLPED
ncbi:MAG: glycosyltransferase [Gammaproteobacteria bacterium]|nr:glycosyltransferase [Gammaproteobacteria bacterium]